MLLSIYTLTSKELFLLNIRDLTSIYPKGSLSQHKAKDESLLSLPIETSVWFSIDKKDLTPTEIQVLTALFPTNSLETHLIKHPWYQYLYNNVPVHGNHSHYRVIHFKLKNESSHKQEWLTHFSHLFHITEDAFFIDDTSGLIIEAKSSVIYDTHYIEDMLLTLEEDFQIRAQVYLGNFNLLTTTFIEKFKEEQRIVSQYTKEQHRVFAFLDIALDYLTHPSVTKSSIMQDLKHLLQTDEEFVDIIKTLWEEQGNLTSTAKKLFIHRNTLQYKLDKFYERTGYTLRNMNDLALCYLAIL